MGKQVTFGQINASIYRNIQMLLSSKLSDLDIKNGQYDFFLVISLNEGLSQKELSEHLHISKSTTAKAVKNLVNKGYVQKQKDELDNRIDHLSLTSKGLAKATDVQKVFNEILDVCSRGLSQDENELLIRLMKKVLESVFTENRMNGGCDENE